MSKFIDTAALNQYTVVINQVELDEVLQKRLSQGIKIEDLFLVVNAHPDEWSDRIDTKYGKLLVFAKNDCPKNVLLWHKKYEYPKINKVNARAFKAVGKFPSRIKIVHENIKTSVPKKKTKKDSTLVSNLVH